MDAIPGLGDVRLWTVDGEPVTLRTYAGPQLIIQFVRYFGCLPCQVYLRALDQRSEELTRMGARAIAVGGSARYQAEWLRDTGITMPLLLDPEHEFRRWMGLGSLSGRQMLSPRGLGRYARAVLAGVRPRRPTSDLMKSPGIAILGPGLEVRWVEEGTSLGDYPPLDRVLEVLARRSDAAGEEPPR